MDENLEKMKLMQMEKSLELKEVATRRKIQALKQQFSSSKSSPPELPMHFNPNTDSPGPGLGPLRVIPAHPNPNIDSPGPGLGPLNAIPMHLDPDTDSPGPSLGQNSLRVGAPATRQLKTELDLFSPPWEETAESAEKQLMMASTNRERRKEARPSATSAQQTSALLSHDHTRGSRGSIPEQVDFTHMEVEDIDEGAGHGRVCPNSTHHITSKLSAPSNAVTSKEDPILPVNVNLHQDEADTHALMGHVTPTKDHMTPMRHIHASSKDHMTSLRNQMASSSTKDHVTSTLNSISPKKDRVISSEDHVTTTENHVTSTKHIQVDTTPPSHVTSQPPSSTSSGSSDHMTPSGPAIKPSPTSDCRPREKLSLPEEVKETAYMSAVQRQRVRVSRIRRCIVAATVIQRAWRQYRNTYA